MRLEQIEEMLLRYRSDNPIERAEGFAALAKFLFSLQDERTRKANYDEALTGGTLGCSGKGLPYRGD